MYYCADLLRLSAQGLRAARQYKLERANSHYPPYRAPSHAPPSRMRLGSARGDLHKAEFGAGGAYGSSPRDASYRTQPLRFFIVKF